ncbi:MAG TPA: DUF3473 domain-containing protein [Woeseiaceae bacterium]|nr:DUF3473 domain-containing protein [Woeseiaceae bacterium]
MSVDVEEYFQVWAFARSTSRADWAGFPSRIRESLGTALRLFDEAGVKATFFTLGWIAERHPDLIRSIADAGHEIASHGYAHAKITEQSQQQFREDVTRAKAILEDVSGQRVLGYRAPSFSIGTDNLWALDVLHETGHEYSSSIYPVVHDHYGMPSASRFPFRLAPGGILEIPMSTANVFGKNLPCGGGGYFRLMPYNYFRWSIRRLNEVEGQSSIFYLHPWELDPDQPRIKNAPLKSRMRHYVNLDKTEGRLRRLLADFRWDRMDRIFLGDCSG